MIVITCNHCDKMAGMFILPQDCELPVMEKVDCGECGKPLWIKYSRWDPDAFTEDEVEVDEATKSIRILK
jgi:hypothetical protein